MWHRLINLLLWETSAKHGKRKWVYLHRTPQWSCTSAVLPVPSKAVGKLLISKALLQQKALQLPWNLETLGALSGVHTFPQWGLYVCLCEHREQPQRVQQKEFLLCHHRGTCRNIWSNSPRVGVRPEKSFYIHVQTQAFLWGFIRLGVR